MSDANRFIVVKDQYGVRQLTNVVSRKSLRDPQGRLVLRANPLTYQHRVRTGQTSTSEGAHLVKNVNGVHYPVVSSDELYSKALSSFKNKAHKGDAALGVTFGSWRQSAEMLTKRLGNVNQLMSRVRTPGDALRLVGDMHANPRGERPSVAHGIANDHLEYIFGWAPMFSDIESAIGVLGKGIAPHYIAGQGKGYYEQQDTFRNSGLVEQRDDSFKRTCRLSAQISVSNPNLWMLNQLGLINPATVAWDLVPWSFVVNMFVNVNQVVSSFTDWVGLEVKDYSRTNSLVGYQDYVVTDHPRGQFAKTHIVYREKNRILGITPETPSLIVKCPKLDWNFVCMASALAVQQSSKIFGLLAKVGKLI